MTFIECKLMTMGQAKPEKSCDRYSSNCQNMVSCEEKFFEEPLLSNESGCRWICCDEVHLARIF